MSVWMVDELGTKGGCGERDGGGGGVRTHTTYGTDGLKHEESLSPFFDTNFSVLFFFLSMF